MLTRLEANGFKNLLDFSIDFGPLTTIAGPNGVGKSNILDAIVFLSHLADNTIMEAALLVRGSDPETSDVRDLFWTDGHTRSESFTLAAEMIVEPNVRDDFGRPAEATSTYLRYEIEIAFEESEYASLGRLILRREKLDYITEGRAARRLRFPHSAARFRKNAVRNRRRTRSGYISVRRASDGQTEILVHQDGGSRGPGQVAPAETAPRTIVGTSNTSATPTILAARREMQSWRVLALEPSAMRRPDKFQSEPQVTRSGGHLPATVFRLARAAHRFEMDGDEVYAAIANRLADLVPVIGLRVDVDEVRQLLTLQIRELSGVEIPAGSLSDGTLRFLTLTILALDTSSRGLICIEEPENGIHPAKLEAMVKLLREFVVDPDEEPSLDNPLRQVILATHSPYFVRLQDPKDLLFALETQIRATNGQPRQTLRCRPLEDTWRVTRTNRPVGKATILAYLTAPPGSQLELPEMSDQIE